MPLRPTLPSTVCLLAPLLVALLACHGVGLDKAGPQRVIPPTIADLPPEEQIEDPAQLRSFIIERIEGGHPIHPSYNSTVNDIDLAALEIEPTDVIADIGCGTGALLMRLLDNGVPFEHYWGVDFDGEALELLRFVLDAAHPEARDRVTLVRNSPQSMQLPSQRIDLAISANTRLGVKQGIQEDRGFQQQRDVMMGSLWDAMVAGGRVHVIEPEEDSNGTIVSKEAVSAPFLENGFVLRADSSDVVGLQRFYSLVFERGPERPGGAPPVAEPPAAGPPGPPATAP